MTFELRIDYKAPSKEHVFLGNGWEPARDVRGAFISGPAAELIIDDWVLSRNFASQLTLTFSMATRSAVDAMVVRASGIFGSSRVIVQKSRQSQMIIPGLYANPRRTYVRILLRPAFGPSETISDFFETIDLVALDELEIGRDAR
jgi:hypothetical protein